MIHVLSVITARPGHLHKLCACYVEHLLPSLRQDAGRFRGAWTSEFGELNKLYALWEYDDVARQEDGRLREIRSWRDGARHVGDMLVETESLLLAPERAITRPPDDGALYDFRIYTIEPMRAGEYARLLQEVLPVRERHSSPFCIWQPLAGNRDRIVHLWPYASLDERASVRARVAQEPEWRLFIERVFPLLIRQQSSLLRPVPGLGGERRAA